VAKKEWTRHQEMAINLLDGSLLLSAAAGSGKTSVLIERIINRITQKDNPCDIDRLVVCTFTEAAANEIKLRLSSRLQELISKEPADVHLKRQQVLLANSNISTIHGFCINLIRGSFQKLDLSGDFTVLKESDKAVYQQEALLEAIEQMYENDEDSSFSDLVTMFGTDKNAVKSLCEKIMTIYNHVMSLPFCNRWFEQKLAMLSDNNFSGNIYIDYLLDYAENIIGYATKLYEYSLKEMQKSEFTTSNLSEAFTLDLYSLKAIKNAVTLRDFNSVMALVHSMKAASYKSAGKKNASEFELELSERLIGIRNYVSAAKSSLLASLRTVFCASEQETAEDNRALFPTVKKLYETVALFDKIFTQIKRGSNCIDFNDMEHLALNLLVKEKPYGGYEYTQEALSISNEFDEILIDEYQDTNSTQELIFKAISKNEENLFVVGDVKQSIYTFRQANPEMFLKRRFLYPVIQNKEDAKYPGTVLLNENFRSRNGITEAVNFIFSQIMSKKVGEIDYNDEEKLNTSAQYPPKQSPDFCFDLIENTSDEHKETAEAVHIANQILKMVGTETVSENGTERLMEYRDISVLLRKNENSRYTEVFDKYGIPVISGTDGSIFKRREVAYLLSYLRAIDNPLLDTALAASMMSPLFGFSPDNMADIRVCDKKSSLYIALCTAAQNGNEQCVSFLKSLDYFRKTAVTLPSDRLIQKITDMTGYLSLIQGFNNPKQRIANLYMFTQYAREYEQGGCKGLSGFIRYIDRLQQSSSDLSQAAVQGGSTNVVNICTIHRSKGLEYPVVFLAGNSKSVKRESDIAIHSNFGVGFTLKDKALKRKYSNTVLEAIKLAKKSGEQSERIRLFYVALTRAKEKLFVTYVTSKLSQDLQKAAGRMSDSFDSLKINPTAVLTSSGFGELLLMCALRHPSGAKLRLLAGMDDNIVICDENPWDINILSYEGEEIPEAINQEADVLIPPSEEYIDSLTDTLSFVYPCKEVNTVLAKTSVSDLVKKDKQFTQNVPVTPAFMGDRTLTAAQKGTLLHRYLELANIFDENANLKNELFMLFNQNHFTKEECEAINLNAVTVFLQSELGQRALKNANSIKREYRFTSSVNAHLINPQIQEELNEQVVVQGIIDCMFEENGELVIIDYKTDYTENGQTLIDRYKKQLEIYTLCAEISMGKKVRGSYIYSFWLGKAIDISV